MDVCECASQTSLTVKDLYNLYDVNLYVLLSGVTSVCKNVIILHAKNIDKSHDFEGAIACCVRSEQTSAHHDWDSRSDAWHWKTRLHRCTEVSVLACDRGDAKQDTCIPTQPATPPRAVAMWLPWDEVATPPRNHLGASISCCQHWTG